MIPWRFLVLPLLARGPALMAGLALLGLISLSACGDFPLADPPGHGETSQARDYYPFTTEGYVIHWGKTTDIRVDLNFSCVTQQPGTCLPGFEGAIQDGINAWGPVHAMLGLNVTFVNTNTENEVRIFWDNGFGNSGYPVGPGVIGFAAVLEQPANPSRIILMTTQCNVCGSPTPHDPSTLRIAAAHEWGHMLGLWNHSYDPADLMYPVLKEPAMISNRDVQTLLHAYTLDPALNLSALPPHALTGAETDHFLIRYVHRPLTDGGFSVEFNPPR